MKEYSLSLSFISVLCLESLSSDSSGELKILAHDSNSLGVDGAQVGVFEKADEIGFSGLLKSEDGGGLESELSSKLVGNLSNESLEGELSDEKIGGLLVLSDFSKGDGSWSVSVGLLNSSGGGSTLSGGLGSELLSGGLSSGGLSGGLFSSGHLKMLSCGCVVLFCCCSCLNYCSVLNKLKKIACSISCVDLATETRRLG